MNEQILADGANVGISQDWAEYLDKFTDIAGSLFAVFFVVLVIVMVVWLGIGAFTPHAKSQIAQRFFGSLAVAALAGCLVSALGWSINSPEDGGAGLGSIEVSGGKQADIELEEYEPKQWSKEDIEGESKDEEEETSPPPSEDPTQVPPTEEPTPEPGGGESKDSAPCLPPNVGQNLSGIVGASYAQPCKKG